MAHLHAVQHLVFVVLPQFKPGHHTFHPALYVIALPYRQVGHFVEDLLEFKGEKLLADQKRSREKAKRVTGSDERRPPQKHPVAGRPLPA
ncbi:hypothetical protein H6S28_17800 [Escherichia coli]|nr:hypothetical protein H6S28_17800 [Escherichia coli]